jgi:hypothetical protein
MFIKRNVVEIALDLDANSVAEKFAKCALFHIATLEGFVARRRGIAISKTQFPKPALMLEARALPARFPFPRYFPANHQGC